MSNWRELADPKICLVFVGLIVVACLPIWSVTNFLGQDEPSHLHSASMMFDLLRNNASHGGFYMLRPAFIPNSLGHWVLAVLMLVFSPIVAGKLLVTFCYAGVVASIGWLRWAMRGRDGVITALLIGAVLGLNWFWLVGLYNFLIGVIVFVIVTGFLYRWDGEINWWRFVLLAVLFLAGYFSHLVSFAVTVMAAMIFVLLKPGIAKLRSLTWMTIALVPVLLLAVAYKLMSEGGGKYSLKWYVLDAPLSFSSVLLHLRTTDGFQIISRRFIPFSDSVSPLNMFASPIIWIMIVFVLLAVGTHFALYDGANGWRKYFPHLAAMAAVMILALVSPDEFGAEQGSVLRPRLLLCGLVLFVPLFSVSSRPKILKAVQIILIAVFAYQVTALWEYSLKVNRETIQFLKAANAIDATSPIASVVILNDQPRFHSNPLMRADNLLGIGRDNVVWDNYETGYYFFPVIAADSKDRDFIREYSGSNSFQLQYADEDFDAKFWRLESSLAANHDKIKTLVVWGQNTRIDELVNRWFETTPYFEDGNIRIYRSRP
jgi:hypothetical protein